MQLIMLSGGQGAGKTTYANMLAAPPYVVRLAFAEALRKELHAEYPQLPWFDLTEEEKSKPREVLGGKSMRDKLISHGQKRCESNPYYWADRFCKTVDALRDGDDDYYARVVICDDLRKLSERGRVVAWALAERVEVTHIHIDGGKPDYDCEQLRGLAHYVMQRRGSVRECEG